MNSTMKRPWWAVFCAKSPAAANGPCIVFGIILMLIGIMITATAHIAPTLGKTTFIIGAVAIFIGLGLETLGFNARFIIEFNKPFVLISIKDDKTIMTILKQPLSNSSYWLWNPLFDPKSGNVVIEYGEEWIETTGKTSMKLHDKDGELVFVTLSATIRANPSADQVIEFYKTHEGWYWTVIVKKWLEEQISKFVTTRNLEDYATIKAKFEEQDDHYDISITDFVWESQFEGLDHELLDYLRSRRDEDSSKYPLDLSICSVDEISLCYE